MASYHQIPMDHIPNRSRLTDPDDPTSIRTVTFADDPPEYTPIDTPRILRTATPHDIAFNPYATSSGPSPAPRSIPTQNNTTSYEPVRVAAAAAASVPKPEVAELPPRKVPISKKRGCFNFWWFLLCAFILLGIIIVAIKWRTIKTLFHIHLPNDDDELSPAPSNSTSLSMPVSTTMLTTTPASTLNPKTLHTTTSAEATTTAKFNMYLAV